LRQVATWLGLGEVVIQPRGDLSDELQTVSR
jgi:uncharacterized protein YcaQ